MIDKVNHSNEIVRTTQDAIAPSNVSLALMCFRAVHEANSSKFPPGIAIWRGTSFRSGICCQSLVFWTDVSKHAAKQDVCTLLARKIIVDDVLRIPQCQDDLEG